MRIATPYELVQKLLGVEATIYGPTGRADVTLLVDTGAFMTTITPRVAALIGYSADDRIEWTITRTAAAEELGYKVITHVDALGVRVEHEVSVADLGYDIDGVIGINFLCHFNVEFRFSERTIVLEHESQS